MVVVVVVLVGIGERLTRHRHRHAAGGSTCSNERATAGDDGISLGRGQNGWLLERV